MTITPTDKVWELSQYETWKVYWLTISKHRCQTKVSGEAKTHPCISKRLHLKDQHCRIYTRLIKSTKVQIKALAWNIKQVDRLLNNQIVQAIWERVSKLMVVLAWRKTLQVSSKVLSSQRKMIKFKLTSLVLNRTCVSYKIHSRRQRMKQSRWKR